MSQSRSMSGVEALTNVVVGYALAVAVQLAVFPLAGLNVSLPQTLGIGAVFTAVSLVRSYLLRRLFERRTGRPSRLPLSFDQIDRRP
jgi:membrane protein implicated in regulation of membrane protease activity